MSSPPATANSTPVASILLDANNLRRARYHPVAPYRRKGSAYGILSCRIGDQNDRHGCRLAGIAATLRAGMTLNDGFERYALLGEAPRDGRGGTRSVAREQTDVVAALVALHRRLSAGCQSAGGSPERWRA